MGKGQAGVRSPSRRGEGAWGGKQEEGTGRRGCSCPNLCSGGETMGPREGEGKGRGCALEEGAGGAALTGLMSRCKKPTEWMASMDSRICLPSRSVVLSVKVPRGWLRRRSARFRPWGWRGAGGGPGSAVVPTSTPVTLWPASSPKVCAHSPPPGVTTQALGGEWREDP